MLQSFLILADPMDCSAPRSSVHEILQARILEGVAISFSMGSSQHRDQTWVCCISGRFFTGRLELGSKVLNSQDPTPYLISNTWYLTSKVGLKLNIQKMKMIASGPITSWQIDGKQWKQCQTLFWGAPKSLQMVIAAMKLKDTYSLEEKLWQT